LLSLSLSLTLCLWPVFAFISLKELLPLSALFRTADQFAECVSFVRAERLRYALCFACEFKTALVMTTFVPLCFAHEFKSTMATQIGTNTPYIFHSHQTFPRCDISFALFFFQSKMWQSSFSQAHLLLTYSCLSALFLSHCPLCSLCSLCSLSLLSLSALSAQRARQVSRRCAHFGGARQRTRGRRTARLPGDATAEWVWFAVFGGHDDQFLCRVEF
jgi:hypothetical protein